MQYKFHLTFFIFNIVYIYQLNNKKAATSLCKKSLMQL